MNKTTVESVQLGRNYSFRADVKLNAWAFVAVALSATSRIVIRHHSEWSMWLRALVALSPLLPSLLYVRSIARWICGMDELQQRIQLGACLFATTGTIFIVLAYNILSAHGIYLPRLPHGLDWEDTFASVIVLYIFGNFIINRRYR
ncbi:MAG TPA: hypothetical protein VH280_04905 [Verrucomicrobiae bacterium]|jgi:hypothetical protein|nr:hypothetical protein [Verrucomicrobiae bacterium]